MLTRFSLKITTLTLTHLKSDFTHAMIQASRYECVIGNYISYFSTKTCCGHSKELSQ